MIYKFILIFMFSLSPFMETDKVNPEKWAMEAMRIIQSNNTNSLVDFFFVSKEQLKLVVLEEMNNNGYKGELLDKLNHDEFLTDMYVKMKNDFAIDLQNEIMNGQITNWSKVTIDSLTYDYIIPKYHSSDIEVPWPKSENYELDPEVRTLVKVRLYFNYEDKPFILRLTPILIDEGLRLVDAKQSVYLQAV